MFEDVYNAMATLEKELANFEGESGEKARESAGVLAKKLNRVSELRSEFYNQYRVVGEWIGYSTLYEMKDHSDMLDEESPAIIENEGFFNNYWAIVSLDQDGCYMDTIEDDFRSAKDAWKRYDEMEIDFIKERYFGPVEKSEKK
jgi:hypothetical protein